jgi:hypothetical protein
MSNAAQIETLREHEVRQKVAQREKNMEKAGEAFEAAMLIERALGLQGIGVKDLPADWSTTRKEHLVWRARMFKQIPEDTFAEWLKEARRNEHLHTGYIRSKADRFVADKKRAARLLQPLGIEGVELYIADIFKVDALRLGKTAAAIITDPPYEEVGLSLWSELVNFAGRTLQNHGWLIAMSGQKYLPSVLSNMESVAKKAGLRYVHTMAIYTPGAESSQVWLSPRNPVNSDWKPIFVYSKGEPQQWPDGIRDFFKSEGNDKDHHKWGQSIGTFKVLVDKFTQPKDLVVDPFVGGGTTIAAAHSLGRAAEGFDINESCVSISRNRISGKSDEANDE